MRNLTALLLCLLTLPARVGAQEAPPIGLEAMETARSRSCVGILARMDTLDAALQPLAVRSQRLQAIVRAISVEERSVVDSLRADDPTEAAVRDWFAADLALAEQYVASRDEAITAQRSAAREEILTRVSTTLAEVRSEAQAQVAAEGSLSTEVSSCDGAILVRPVVLEACGSAATPLCNAAAAPDPSQRYRFVESAADLWDVSEFRPWTDPGPLQVAPDGQVGGARTVAYARQGNVALTLAFEPLLRQRALITPEQVARLEAITDSLDFPFSHPDIVFAPSLNLRAYLPEPLAEETSYVLHFGEGEEVVALWAAAAGSGEATDATIAMGPAYAVALASGAPVSFTATTEAEDGSLETVFSIQFAAVNQSRAVTALMGYMSSQFSADLSALVPPGGGG